MLIFFLSTLVIISGRTLSFILSTLINSLVVAVFNLNFSTLYILSNSSFIIKSSRADSVKYFNSLSFVYTLYNFSLGISKTISVLLVVSSVVVILSCGFVFILSSSGRVVSVLVTGISFFVSCFIGCSFFIVCFWIVVFELPNKIEVEGFSKSNIAILNSTKINNLGWKAYYSIKEGIHRTLEILRVLY